MHHIAKDNQYKKYHSLTKICIPLSYLVRDCFSASNIQYTLSTICAFYSGRCWYVRWAFVLNAQLPARALFTDIIPQFGDARRCKIISGGGEEIAKKIAPIRSGECARVCRQHHNAPPGSTRRALSALCVRPIVLYIYVQGAAALCHPALWRRCLHTHMHALHLQKGNQGSNCIENSQEKANGPKLLRVRRRLEAAPQK